MARSVADSGGGVLINQAIHTLDLMEWLLGDVDRSRPRRPVSRWTVPSTSRTPPTLLLEHAGGARSVMFATVANVIDSPVTIEIVTERAVLLIRGDLTVSYADGRIETVAERAADQRRTGVLGRVPRLLIADFYRPVAPTPSRSGSARSEGARSTASGPPDLPTEQLTPAKGP